MGRFSWLIDIEENISENVDLFEGILSAKTLADSVWRVLCLAKGRDLKLNMLNEPSMKRILQMNSQLTCLLQQFQEVQVQTLQLVKELRLRLTMDIIFCVDTNQTTPARDFCFFRLSLLTPRCDRATFLQHMSEVSDMGVYNHELVRVFYDKLHRFNCPKYNMGGKQSCTLKMSIPYPRNVQLDSDGNFRDNHDEMYLRGNNILSTSPIITSLGHVKLSYIDL